MVKIAQSMSSYDKDILTLEIDSTTWTRPTWRFEINFPFFGFFWSNISNRIRPFSLAIGAGAIPWRGYMLRKHVSVT